MSRDISKETQYEYEDIEVDDWPDIDEYDDEDIHYDEEVPSYQSENERIIIEDYIKRNGITEDDLDDLSPSELRQKIRNNKLDTLL